MSSLALSLFPCPHHYSEVTVSPFPFFPFFQCSAYRINVGNPSGEMQGCCVWS